MRPTLPCRLRIRAYTSSIAAAAPVQRSIRAAYYRGGTSRAVILHPQDLPSDLKVWPDIFRQLMGSGDPYGRQLDGMGAGISSLSKICLVESYAKDRGSEPGNSISIDTKTAHSEGTRRAGEDNREAHIDYTFVGLGIEHDEVDVAGNCGNMSSAIGPYAYNARLLPRKFYEKADGKVTVRIRNTNTGKLIDSTFPVVRKQAAVTGDYSIDGVTGKGSRIKLDFQQPYGSKTGKVLPTGKKVDIINGYRVTCVDGANPAVFIRADDIGVDGTILPNDFNKLPEKLQLLERIRVSAAVTMGIAETEDQVPRTIPKIGIVSMSSTHQVLSGTTLNTSQLDLVVRFISDTQPHRAIPLTAALTTAVAARIPGTIVEQLLAPDPAMEDVITIGHASGRLQVNATMDSSNKLIPLSATVYRTAKRLFEGNVYWVPDVDPVEGRTGISRKRRSLGMAFVAQNRTQSHVYPTETTVKGSEVTRAREHVAPYLDEGQDPQHEGSQPQHASLEPTEDPVPHSSLGLPDYPSEEVSPRNFKPKPKARLESPELAPVDQARHSNYNTVTEQASGLQSSPASRETTWEPPFSGFLDAEEASGNLAGYSSQARDSRAQNAESTDAGVRIEPDFKSQDEASDESTIDSSWEPRPVDPIIDKQNIKREITAAKIQIEALQKHISTLKIVRRTIDASNRHNQSIPSYLLPPYPVEDPESPKHDFPASSPEKGKEWRRFFKDFSKRKSGYRHRVKQKEESESLRAMWKEELNSHFKLDKKGNLIKSRKEKSGRGW